MRFTDTKKIDQKTGRAINRRLILNLIRRTGGLSRSDLAERTGLSAAAVGFVVSDLISEGYIVAGEPSGAGAGRKPVPLVLNNDGHLAIGVKTSTVQVDCILTNFGIDVLDSLTVPVTQYRAEDVLAVAASGIRQLIERNSEPKNILGVGLSVPGRVDPSTGICIRSHRFGWDQVPVARMLSDEIGMPVYIEDDTLAYGLAHHMYGLGQASDNFAALAVGDGIGYAVISDSKVRRGALGNAGKVGHVLHDKTGPLCECGRHGCLQAWYSYSALQQRWEASQSGSLAAAVTEGNSEAIKMVAEAGHEIGRHLSEWVTVTDPERIVLGGEAVSFGDAFIDPLRDALAAGYYRDTPPPIIPDQSNYYWAAGAAAVVVQQVFDFESAPEEAEANERDPISP